jgi:hypothetical protein
MSRAIFIVFFLGGVISASASEDTRTFHKPAAAVFEAAFKVAQDQGTVLYSDKDHFTITFKSGGYWNKGFEVQIKIEESGSGSARVLVKPQKDYFGAGWGASNRISKMFFEDLDKALR